MATIDEIYSEANTRMEKSIESLKKDFLRIRAGKASPALIDGVMVDYYGTPTPISQIATVSVPEPRMLVLQPWEKTMIAPLEKAILASDLGFNPQNDGNIIRIPIPALSEERRKELYKNCKQMSEESKVAIRNIRRDANEKIKKAEKDKDITQDDQKKGLERIQKLTDSFIASVDAQLSIKEKEIMSI